jgi:diketogulonate reductase-like aldo/keto reductase
MAMEALLTTNKVKAIGVSNFNIRRLADLLAKTTIIPAVNQIEKHPYLQQNELAAFCQANGILLEGYSPLGNNQTGEPRTVDDIKVHEIAGKMELDPGQVLLSWGVQKGHVVLSKSVTESRIKSNFKDVVLPQWAMDELDALERNKRFNFPARWGSDVFDEMGVDAVRKAAEDAGEENKMKFVV